MAIFNNHVQQAAGSDNITFEQLEDSRILAGLYKLQVDESFSIYRDNKNRNIYLAREKCHFLRYFFFDEFF